MCSSSTIHLIIKKFQTRLTKDIKGRGGVQVIIWYIKDKYLPSKSSKLAQTTWHSMHTMKNWVKWVMEFLFTNQDLNVDINCSNGLQWNPRYLGIKQLRCEQVVPNYVESCQLAELGKCNSHNRPIRDICPGDLLVYLVIPIPFDLQCQAFSFVLWDIIIYIYFMSDQISINSCQSMSPWSPLKWILLFPLA